MVNGIETKSVLETLFLKADNKSRSSVSRSLRRLEERGLVERYFLRQVSGYLISSGIKLTDKGIKTVKELK